jgi:hypothetical protein
MSLSREPVVRARFVRALCLFVLVPICLAGMLAPKSMLYTVGVALPLSFLTYRCFRSGAHRFSNAMSLSQYRLTWLSSLVLAGALHWWSGGIDFAAGWYISAAAFVFGEPIAQDCLVALGFGDRYSFDRSE